MARKSKRQQDSAAETLDQLESLGDSAARWASENPQLIVRVIIGILALAAVAGYLTSRESSGVDAGSAELARIQSAYRAAMGAGLNDLEITEPANPEIGRSVRAQYLEEFRGVSETYAGTVSGALALLEVASLEEAMGDPDAAIATLSSASEGLDKTNALYAMTRQRLAWLYETQGDAASAAAAYEAAGSVASYPLRYAALAEAARCYAAAEENEDALRVFDRIETEAPEFNTPEHIASKLRELRAAAANI